MTKHVISIVVDNNANVMARVSSLFARRRFNMTSVTAAQTSDPSVSIITIVTEGDSHILDQIVKQTLKMEEVKSITLLPPNESLLSETLMLRIAFSETNISRIKDIVEIDIPYPRTQETKMTPRFLELKNHIWGQVYQEYLEVRK